MKIKSLPLRALLCTMGWVGLSWTLNAGGVITGSVRGNPDDNCPSDDFSNIYNKKWPDYAFCNNFHVLAQSEVEPLIKEIKHLPSVPSQTEVKENGLNLEAINAVLLKKVEVLTCL